MLTASENQHAEALMRQAFSPLHTYFLFFLNHLCYFIPYAPNVLFSLYCLPRSWKIRGR